MATSFFLRTKKKSGFASVCVRVQSSVLGVNIRQSTNLKVSIQKWNLSHSSLAFRDFVNSPEGRKLFKKIEEIRLTIDEKIISGKGVTADQVRKIVYDVVYREFIQTDAPTMTLTKYVDLYLEQAISGKRKTQKGYNFSYGTIKSIRGVCIFLRISRKRLVNHMTSLILTLGSGLNLWTICIAIKNIM